MVSLGIKYPFSEVIEHGLQLVKIQIATSFTKLFAAISCKQTEI